MAELFPPTVLAVSEAWKPAFDALTAVPPFSAAALLGKVPPSRLYHFTDCEGLIGIFQSRKLRASLATAMRDPSEVTHAFKVVSDLLVSGALTPKRLPLSSVREIFIGRNAEFRPYVVSFCETEESAPLWLHYGCLGCGVAIGCDTSTLEKSGFRLAPVAYKSEEQTTIVRRVIETVDNVLVEHLGNLTTPVDRDLLLDVAAGIAAEQLSMAAPLMKNQVYEAEREWRLIAYQPRGEGSPLSRPPQEIGFRCAAGRVVPYTECDIELTPAFEIVLGFSSPINEIDMALSVLMEANLDRPITVRRSKSPVRP